MNRGKHTRSHSPETSPTREKPRPALDLKRLSNEELAQLTLDIDDELTARCPPPGQPTGGIRSTQFSGNSGKDLDKQKAAIHQRFKSELKAFYVDSGALGDFEQLVSDGCDSAFLFYTVMAIRLAYQFHAGQDSFEKLAGFSRKKLKTVIGRLRQAAKNIHRLRVNLLANLVPRAHQQLARYVGLQSRLPSELKELAEVTEEAARRLRLRGRPEYDTVIAELVRHVEERTNKPHEKQLAALIAFATDNRSFTAENLRNWRMEH